MDSTQGAKTGLLAAGTIALSLTGAYLIQSFEGYMPNTYLDVGGIPTACYGSTENVVLGKTYTQQECQERFFEDTKTAQMGVQMYTKRKVTQAQYDAMVSLTYNIGVTAFSRSTLLRKLNSGETVQDCYAVSDEFLRWNKVNGKVVKGLTRRRVAEREMFRGGCPAWERSSGLS